MFYRLHCREGNLDCVCHCLTLVLRSQAPTEIDHADFWHCCLCPPAFTCNGSSWQMMPFCQTPYSNSSTDLSIYLERLALQFFLSCSRLQADTILVLSWHVCFNATATGAAATASSTVKTITSINQFLQEQSQRVQVDCRRTTKLYTENTALPARSTAPLLFRWTGKNHAGSIS